MGKELEPTAENMTEVAKTLHAVGERVKEVAERSESERKEMEERLTGEIQKVAEAADKITQNRILGDIANDYSFDGRSVFERVLSDPGPVARMRRGEVLGREDRFVADFQRLSDEILVFCSLAGVKEPTEANVERALCTDPRTSSEGGRRAWARFTKMREQLRTSNVQDTTIAATDVEFAQTGWIPTLASPQLQMDYRLNLKVAALFRQVDMPHSPYEFPVMWARDALTYACPGEQLATTAQWTNVLGTGLKMTFTAKKFHKASYVSDEAMWESIVPMVPTILADHADFIAYAIEYAIVNGDTTATHQDTDIEAAGTYHAGTAFKGLRKLAIAGSCKTDVNSNPYKTSTMRGLRASMGKYGVVPTDVALLVSPAGYIQLLSNADVKTYDVFGPQATILQGQLASFDGHPVIVSECMREDLDATGVNGASGNTFGAYLYVNKNMFAVGNRLGLESKYSDDALMLYGAKAFVSQKRVDFQPQLTPSTTNSTVWYGYNIT